MTLSYVTVVAILLPSLVLLSIGLVTAAPSYTSNTQDYTQISSSPVGRSFAPTSAKSSSSHVATASAQAHASVSQPLSSVSQANYAPAQAVSSVTGAGEPVKQQQKQFVQHPARPQVQARSTATAQQPIQAKSLTVSPKSQPVVMPMPISNQAESSKDLTPKSVQAPAPAPSPQTAQGQAPVSVVQAPVQQIDQAPVQQVVQTPASAPSEQVAQAPSQQIVQVPVSAPAPVPAQSQAQSQAQSRAQAQAQSRAPADINAKLFQLSAQAVPTSAQISQAQVPSQVVEKSSIESVTVQSSQKPAAGVSQGQETSEATSFALTSLVRGGMGPLHLLAETLCDPQPERLGDDSTPLYAQRQSARKSLFDFMSLKFTDLGKLSSRLSGVAYSPSAVLASVPSSSLTAPLYHGANDLTLGQAVVVSQHQSPAWPVIGACTSQDLKLMAEAAWCDCIDTDTCKASHNSQQQQQIQRTSASNDLVLQASNQTVLIQQQQLIDEQRREKERERECKKRSLRLARNLFNHLAESQTQKSASWPALYAELNSDECARLRLIDIVNALASFRSTELVRRDNVEFAFAMDDLRVKVLDSDITAPLQVDEKFIALEQFLQQSVQLVLSNIDPQRSRTAAARYRSLLPSAALSASDYGQCVELHQRLLSRTPTVSNSSPVSNVGNADQNPAQPNVVQSQSQQQQSQSPPQPQQTQVQSDSINCSPNQLGQLPDILRMTAKSLELWSLEIDLARHNKRHMSDYVPMRRQEIVDCVSNLVD